MAHFVGITTAYAFLAIVATVLVAAALALRLVTALWPRSARAWAALRGVVTPVALPAAWIVSIIATTGSLYMSEIAGLLPCKLCWFQRIAMYPLVVVLGIATVRGELWVARRYLAPVALIGAAMSIYHYQLERFPQQATLSCGGEAPCNVTLVLRYGFVSLPYMALAAFALIATLLLVATDDEAEAVEAGPG